MRWVMVLCLAGCGFAGDEGRLAFDSNLNGTAYMFTPSSVRVAVGSAVVFRAHEQLSDRPPPQATPVVDDPTFFASLDAGPDVLSGVVAHAGDTVVRWEGATRDRFTLRAAAAMSATVEDPLRRPRLEWNWGAPWPSPGPEVVLARSTKLYLEILLHGDDDAWLAHSAGSASPSTQGAEVSVSGVGPGLVLAASDAGAGASQRVDVSFRGQVLGGFQVRVDDLSAVETLELSASTDSVPGLVFVKATARLPGGSVLWQAPIRWEHDARLAPYEVPEIVEPYAPRPDVLILQVPESVALEADDAGYWSTTVSASSGAASSSLTLRIPVERPSPPPPPPDAGVMEPEPVAPIDAGTGGVVTPPPAPPRGCGCGAGDGLVGLAGLIVVLRRRGACPRAPAPPTVPSGLQRGRR